jgi:hypothetical protein
MLRALLRLTTVAILSTILFSILAVVLGYLSIDVLKWHGTKFVKPELATLRTGVIMTAPIFFGLALLGMLLAWRDARNLSASRLAILASGCPVILAILFTLEDIPRNWADWLGFLLPVGVVVIHYWATRSLGVRDVAGAHVV